MSCKTLGSRFYSRGDGRKHELDPKVINSPSRKAHVKTEIEKSPVEKNLSDLRVLTGLVFLTLAAAERALLERSSLAAPKQVE